MTDIIHALVELTLHLITSYLQNSVIYAKLDISVLQAHTDNMSVQTGIIVLSKLRITFTILVH